MNTSSNQRNYPLSPRSVKLAHVGLWLFGLLAAVSVFSLAREALAPSWPLLRACAHGAVLVVSAALYYATALVLHRHKASLPSGRTPTGGAAPTAAPKTHRTTARPVLH